VLFLRHPEVHKTLSAIRGGFFRERSTSFFTIAFLCFIPGTRHPIEGKKWKLQRKVTGKGPSDAGETTSL
jgi:hypothetical protein